MVKQATHAMPPSKEVAWASGWVYVAGNSQSLVTKNHAILVAIVACSPPTSSKTRLYVPTTSNTHSGEWDGEEEGGLKIDRARPAGRSEEHIDSNITVHIALFFGFQLLRYVIDANTVDRRNV